MRDGERPGMALRETDPGEGSGYRIEDRLGSGGMGVVHLARSASGHRLAVKVVHAQHAADDEFPTRSRREVAAARHVGGAFTASVVNADAPTPGGPRSTSRVRISARRSADKALSASGPAARPRRRARRGPARHPPRHSRPPGPETGRGDARRGGPRVIGFGISRAAEFARQDRGHPARPRRRRRHRRRLLPRAVRAARWSRGFTRQRRVACARWQGRYVQHWARSGSLVAWADENATGLICWRCAYVQLFVNKDIKLYRADK
ncbi:hypothetical protein GCM10027072_45000 [Streptomyces bullii]